MKARHWLLSGALAAAAVAVFLVVFVPPVGFNEMGACGEVTGSGCRPFVEAVYESLGERAQDVRAIRARSWCGELFCQPVFGGSPARLEVTFVEDPPAEYECWQAPLQETASCELAR